jgi:hypothetical protein
MKNLDVVVPNNNEKELIEMAIKSGFEELVLLSENINYQYDIRKYLVPEGKIIIKKGFLAKDISHISKARKRFDYIFANAERKFFEQKIDYIINSELSDRKDSFHYRNTSLNQVHAKLAKENNITIVFNLGLLLESNMRNKQIFFGRMLQNARLVNKYKLKHAIFSLASKPSEMRGPVVMKAMENVLGL